MRISYNWIKEYVDVNLPPEDLANRLTMAGFEVESMDPRGAIYANFVVGEVLQVRKHPGADRLTICMVNIGREVLQIVCGAPNVEPNQKVAVGLVGAIIPHDQHDPQGKPFVLSHVQVRKEDSFGMICSAFELGLGADKDGIMILEKEEVH